MATHNPNFKVKNSLEVVGTITAAGAVIPVTLNTQTASYTAVAADKGKIVEMNVTTTANTFTIPPNVFAVNDTLDVVQLGTGATTITAGAGVELLSSGSKLKLTGRYSAASLYQRAANSWVVVGDLS